MIKEIVKLVFQQAKDETPNTSKTGLSKHISRKIEENDSRKIFSYKTFTRYYDKYILDKSGVIDHPQAEIIEELCKYLGYKSYQDFVISQKSRETSVVKKENAEVKNIDNQGLVKLEKATKIKELTEVIFVNNNLSKQLAVTIILILGLMFNWTDKECVFCLEQFNTEYKIQSSVYDDIMNENSKKMLDSIFVSQQAENLYYGAEWYNF